MKKLMIFIIGMLLIVNIYVYFENTTLKISGFTIKKSNLPSDFKNFKIAHISDFHNTRSNRLKNKIINSIEKSKPDILVITGDLIDSRRTNMDISLEFIKKIKNIPIYYVAGNHESRIKMYSEFKTKLKELNVHVLENEKVTIKKGDSQITLIGIQDPAFEISEDNHSDMIPVVDNYLEKLANNNNFEILLAHRPELLDVYSEHNIDLVFSGHAHGGQIILPFLGPIIAPNQGFFPEITEGVYTKNATSLVVSRGIGNSLCPIRINNKPELIYVMLEK